MPWKETCAMDEKVQMIGDWLNKEHTISELGKHYRVSRKTVSKWIRRFRDGGLEALKEASCAPYQHPNATAPEIVSQVIDTKLRHQYWGPKKVLVFLKRQHPDQRWPAISTAQSILYKEGLVNPRKVRRHTPPYSQPFQECLKPNDSWSIDYKGQFKTGDNRLCYPLTITDNYSRYLLTCHGLRHPSYESTRPQLEQAFQEYGLPQAVRSDNGTPFASTGLGGLSRLSVWLIRLQVIPERIVLAHPEQNGRHERMHRSLKEAVCQPPKSCLSRQQMAFNHFKTEFNDERPHEALDMKTPASLYTSSHRQFPAKLPPIEYDSWLNIRRVLPSGGIKWRNNYFYLSQALAGEPVGLKQVADTVWEVWFSFLRLGLLDENKGKVSPMSPV
jgi:transposase InsO family protein/transposase-like protein